jgi:hypothetical protein
MNTRLISIKKLVMRHRVTLQDLTLLVAAVLVTAYVLLQVDVFAGSGARPVENTIESDELPILGAVLSIGMLVFAWRRMRQQKRETVARLQAQAQLSRMAFQDALTGLPNRRSLLDRLNVAASSPPAAGAVHALMMRDLNGFKRINDAFGHGVSDQTVIVVGQRLLTAVREGDLVAPWRRRVRHRCDAIAERRKRHEPRLARSRRPVATHRGGSCRAPHQRRRGGMPPPFNGATPDEALSGPTAG